MVVDEKSNKIICKYGCGAKFDRSPEGQASLMRHYKMDCPNNPKVQGFKKEKKDEQIQKVHSGIASRTDLMAVDDELLDELEVLDKIIGEVYFGKKRGAILRFVRRHMDSSEESLKALSEACRLADVNPTQRNLILRNWAAHLEVDDVEDVLDHDGKDQESFLQKKEKKAVKDKKEEKPPESLDDELEKLYKDQMRELKKLRVQKEIDTLRNELDVKPKENADEQKVDLVIDGALLKVSPEQFMAYKKWQVEQKRLEDEREARKAEDLKRLEEAKQKKDDVVEWPVGDKIIKVKPETIPLLIMNQNKGSDSEKEILREEMRQMREQFQGFQMQTYQQKINELEQIASQDPLDRIFSQKEKLERLGLVSTNKANAQERLMDMEGKKLDTLLTIAVDKNKSLENKVDSLMGVFGPVAQEYLRQAISNMKQNRGEMSYPEASRSNEEYNKALENLETLDKELEKRNTDEQARNKVVTAGSNKEEKE